MYKPSKRWITMSDFEYMAKDLQRSVEDYEREKQRLSNELSEALQDRDRWRDIAYSLARSQANEFGGDMFQVIEDEKKWLEDQKSWTNSEGIKDE